jgi:DNA end-binding protein Ku
VARTAWKGNLSVGGVINIPVRLEKTTSDTKHDVALHEYHSADMGQGGRKVYCKKCGSDLKKEEVIKGFEVAKGQVVTFTPQEMDSLPIKSAKVIDLTFVPENEITPIAYEDSYYIRQQDDASVQAFVMLMTGMASANKVGVGKITLSQREHLCVIHPTGKDYLLSLLRWGDELNPSPSIPTVETPPANVDLMKQIIGMFSKTFQISEYVDSYTTALRTMAENKRNGVVMVAEEAAPTQQMTLVEAMKRLVESGK